MSGDVLAAGWRPHKVGAIDPTTATMQGRRRGRVVVVPVRDRREGARP